jgi:hypothetical protein
MTDNKENVVSSSVNIPTRIPEDLYKVASAKLSELGGKRKGHSFQSVILSLLKGWVEESRESPRDNPRSRDVTDGSQTTLYDSTLTSGVTQLAELARRMQSLSEELENTLATKAVNRANRELSAASHELRKAERAVKGSPAAPRQRKKQA